MKENINFNILVVDDQKLNIELAYQYLKNIDGYNLSYALDAKSALELIYNNRIDLILLDIGMPDIDGFKLCKMLKSESETKDIPVIFLTAHTKDESISNAFEVGGADYINKPFNPIELQVRVKTQLNNIHYLNQIKQKQSKLAQLSITDQITKAHNSLYFETNVKTFLSKQEKFWILYIKIDSFDKVNQLYGFNKANKIIRSFSDVILQGAPSKTLVARLYGANFALALKNYTKEDIKKIDTKLYSGFKKSDELYKKVTYSRVALRVEKPISLSAIYKKLQSKVDDTKTSSLFIN